MPPDTDLVSLAGVGCGQITGAGKLFIASPVRQLGPQADLPRSGAILHYLQPRTGSTVAVFGIGAVGAAAIMAASVSGGQRCTIGQI
jgi:hypothetical protein